jgi:hypothetical protein
LVLSCEQFFGLRVSDFRLCRSPIGSQVPLLEELLGDLVKKPSRVLKQVSSGAIAGANKRVA